MGFQLRERQALARLHDGVDTRAQILIRKADDAARLHERMLVDRRFHFSGIDIGAAHQDQVGAAVGLR